jgi:uncharacterized protein (TIGR04255 family)
MRLPKKLSPHLLLETFVEVHFETTVPSEVAFGAFYGALKPRYTYVPVQAQTVAVPNVNEALQLRTQQESMFLGEETVLRVRDGHVSFNSVDGQYLGWNQYSQLIKWVLEQLQATNQIKHFTQVGVRYINGLPWRPFNEQLRVQLLNLPGQPEPERTHIQTSLRTPDGLLVNLTVTDQQPIFNQRERQTLFDVDVVWQAAKPTTDLAEVFEHLEQVHLREKEVFFGLLNEDFLATLDPEYE